MLKERIISAVIGVPIIIAILYTGGVYWIAFFALLGIAGLYEFNRIISQEFKPVWILNILLLLIIMFSSFDLLIVPALVLFLLLLVIYLVIMFPKITIVDIALSLFPALYIGFSLNFAILLNNHPHAFLIMLLIFLFTWSSDVGGYVFGRFWGRHKLAPELSPNKTWEGAIGGILLSIFTAFIFFTIFKNGEQNIFFILLLGILSSSAAQLGDLFMSGVKRRFTIKDTGSLIPGHGGVLDRFDSFLLVLPIVYCCIYYGKIL